MRRLVLAFVLSFVAVLSADAQKSKEKESEMKPFSAIEVSDEFSLTLRKGEDYVLKTIVDGRLEPYVIARVKDGVLYLGIERKKIAPEVKKDLRTAHSKGVVIKAEVTVPFVNSLEVSEDAVVECVDVIETDSFILKAADKASVENLTLICSNAEVNVSKSASVDMEINASSLMQFKSSGSSKSYLKHTGDSLAIASTGSSEIEVIVDSKGIMVDNSGMSNVKLLSGKVGNLKVTASGSAKFNSADLPVASAYMIQSGSSKSIVNVTDTLKVNLVGNSTLEFMNNPYIDLERVVSSTLTRYNEASSK